MGWGKRALLLVLGLASFGFGLWPVGAICFLLGFLPAVNRGSNPTGRGRAVVPLSRGTLGIAFGLLGLASLASGGAFSVLVFFSLAALLLLGPLLGLGRGLWNYAEVPGSILCRSAWCPLLWCALAELKPATDPLARSLSSFRGVMIFLPGRSFAVARVPALGRRSAEQKALASLRNTAASLRGRAFLLPLDSGQLKNDFSRPLERLVGAKSPLAQRGDMIVLDAERGLIVKTGEFGATDREVRGLVIPTAQSKSAAGHLTWEVLEVLAKRGMLAGPDEASGFLESFSAAKGEPFGERLGSLSVKGPSLRLESLGGAKVELSRPQARALAAIYG
ncbi:MAG: hypothetical protein HY247_07985 [archaeon]|nr:MAG: hypothetical protein HY247_07985 [archaeon]